MTAFLWSLPPIDFWILYSDYNYFGAFKDDRKYVFEHIIRCKYVKETKIDCALAKDNQDYIVEDNSVFPDDFLVSDPYSDYNVHISIKNFQNFLLENRTTLIEAIINNETKELLKPNEKGILDLSNKNITAISVIEDYPYTDQVETLLLAENWLQNPSLPMLRKLFPNLKSISFSRCPLIIPEQEGRIAWLNNLYAMHEYQRGEAIQVKFPFFGNKIIGYLPVYAPLTIYVSSDCLPETYAALTSIANTKWYTNRRIFFKMTKIFFYIAGIVGTFLSYMVEVYNRQKNNYYSNISLSNRESDYIKAFDWCINGIKAEYKSEWRYKIRPTIIVE